MKKVELEIVALSHSVTQTHSYAVVLGEVNGLRRIPIIIGGFEAQAIAVALERMTPTRPLTHDLMKNFMLAFQIDLHEMIISDVQEGVFFSKLICSSPNDTIEIDSRTSDAIALAVRFGCPIYTYEEVLEQVGMTSEEDGKKVSSSSSTVSTASASSGGSVENLKYMSTQELKEMLDNVLEQEDYIKAIAIRDELNSRQEK
jgi:bifunctional DNase/RNase